MALASGSAGSPPGRRILFVLRVYSGLEKSLQEGVWQPQGVPTIYRLIETLDREAAPCRIVLTSRDGAAAVAESDRDLRLQGLGMPVRVLAPPERWPRWLGRFRFYLAQLANAWKVYQVACRFRPHALYVDRGNLWIAGLLSRFGGWPVVYRVMGISDALVHAGNGHRLTHVVERWLLRSRFAVVVCTQDGSGGERWLGKLFRSDVPTHLMLNGVDLPARAATSPAEKVRIGFVGRLEEIKGCQEFLRAFLRARQERPGRLQAVIVGGGPLAAALADEIAEAGAEADVICAGSLPHRSVQAVYPTLDIYVSLNRQGNLSNANLEAFSAGCCSIVPQGDPTTGRDVALDGLFPGDTLFRIAHPRDIDALVAAMLWLHDHPGERADRGVRTALVAGSHIPSWQHRVSQELSIIDDILATRPA